MNGRGSRTLALGVAAVATAAVLFELGRSAFAFRPTVEGEDYDALNQARATSEFPQAPVYVGQRWLEPQARMSWPELADPRWFARPDVGTTPNFWVLDHRSNRGLPQLIAEDLWPGQQAPRNVERHRSGGLTLTRYELAAAQAVGDLADQPITAEVAGVGCKGTLNGAGGGKLSCGGRTRAATVRWTEVEVEFRPRSCLAIEMPAGGTLDLVAAEFPLGQTLVGHVGFGDYNDRIRNDAPVDIELSHEGQPLLRTVVSDEQGWHRFEASGAPADAAGLEIRIRMPPTGTWHKSAPSRRDVKTLCLELRSVQSTGDR